MWFARCPLCPGSDQIPQRSEMTLWATSGLDRLGCRSWLSTASENQISEYGTRIANAAGESVLTEFASAVERIGNL